MIVQSCSSSKYRSIFAALCAIWLIAGSAPLLAEEGEPPGKPDPVLKYDPEFPDSMVVATVNSEPITVGEVLGRIRGDQDYFELDRGDTLPADQREKFLNVRIQALLPAVIAPKLQVQGLTADLNAGQLRSLDKFLEGSWADYLVELREAFGVATMEQLAERLNLAETKKEFREASMAYQFSLGLMLDNWEYEPTRRELDDLYNQRSAGRAPTRVKWQQIVVRVRKDEARAHARSRALDLWKQLQAGTDFSELARSHSDGRTKEQGGNWDWTECESLACEELGTFLSTGKIGSTSEVIAHEDEYHIAKIQDRDEGPTRSFEEVEPELREALKQAGRQWQFRRAMQKFIDQSKVQTVFGNNRELTDRVLEQMMACPNFIYGPAGITMSPPRWNREGSR